MPARGDVAPEDISENFASGWAWASGGIVSTPLDLNRFIRGYVGGKLFGTEVRKQQRVFIPGESEPPGPGVSADGLALFRYKTRCGTMYGHSGFTQCAAANSDGSRSMTISMNLQRTHENEGQAAAVLTAFRKAALLASAPRSRDSTEALDLSVGTTYPYADRLLQGTRKLDKTHDDFLLNRPVIRSSCLFSTIRIPVTSLFFPRWREH